MTPLKNLFSRVADSFRNLLQKPSGVVADPLKVVEVQPKKRPANRKQPQREALGMPHGTSGAKLARKASAGKAGLSK